MFCVLINPETVDYALDQKKAAPMFTEAAFFNKLKTVLSGHARFHLFGHLRITVLQGGNNFTRDLDRHFGVF
jgi:hypothetical protein